MRASRRLQTGIAVEGRGRSRGRDQRLRDGERRRLMAIFALTEYARDLAEL